MFLFLFLFFSKERVEEAYDYNQVTQVFGVGQRGQKGFSRYAMEGNVIRVSTCGQAFGRREDN